MTLTLEQHAEVERYDAWAKKISRLSNVIARSQAAFLRRGKVRAAMRSSSTKYPGHLEQLTAFPTAVFNPQLGEWQLALPETR